MTNEPNAAKQVHSRRAAVWVTTAGLMLLPVLALRGTGRGQWDIPGDFMFLGLLLAGIGLAYELTARVSDRRAYPVAVGVAVVTSMLQAWINLAVGVIGSEDNPVNAVYAVPIAVAVLGSVLARLQTYRMVYAMVAAAVAQLLVFVVALVGSLGFTGPITVFFTGLWLLSAWLFRRAGAAA